MDIDIDIYRERFVCIYIYIYIYIYILYKKLREICLQSYIKFNYKFIVLKYPKL